MKPEELLELSKEKLVEKLQEFNLEEEQIMASMVMIREEILARFEEEKKDGELIGEYEVSRRVRVNVKTPIEVARELGATKTEEKVDNTKIKKIYQSGVKVEGVTEKPYLSVRRVQQDEQEK